MDRCKSNGIYLIGKINLTDIVSACQNSIITPRWIGVVKESYTSYDKGKGKSKRRVKVNLKSKHLNNFFK